MQPLAQWDNDQSTGKNLVWWSTLDGRYQVEVQRTDDYHGSLVIFDHQDNDKELASFNVGLLYGAVFGPDVQDIARWQDMAASYIDTNTT